MTSKRYFYRRSRSTQIWCSNWLYHDHHYIHLFKSSNTILFFIRLIFYCICLLFLLPRQHFPFTMWRRWLMSTLQMLLLCKFANSMPGSTTNFRIHPKPCTVNALDGTCMFVWECIKSEGLHLGMCMDSFMFGSCCGHNLSTNAILPSSSSLSTFSSAIATQHFDFKKPPHKKPKPPVTLATNTTANRPSSSK